MRAWVEPSAWKQVLVIAGPKGTGAFRLDFNAVARTITIFSGTAPGGPWYGTTQTLSLDTLPLPPYVISSLRVGLWGRQWTVQVGVERVRREVYCMLM